MPKPTVYCLSWSYHNSPIDTRTAVATAIRSLHERYVGRDGHVALLTCNRAELYVDSSRFPLQPDDVLTTLGASSFADVQTTHRLLQGNAACRHLLRVAAGLESMVLGEPQILGQVCDAWEEAVAQKSAGPLLHTLFEAAVHAGKRVRHETEISRHPASMSSVAIHSLLAGVGDPRDLKALVIGYGDMCRLAIKALRGHGVQHIGIANRRIVRAADAAAQYGYRLWALDHLAEALAWADVVFTAVAAPAPQIGPDLLKQVLDARGERRLVAVDIAVPQNIAAKAATVPGFTLIGIDQLQRGVDRGLAARRQCLPAAETILAQEYEQLKATLHELDIRPLLRDLRLKAETIRKEELERTIRYMGVVDENTRQQLQYFSKALINKLLHEPTLRLRQKATIGEAEPYAEIMRELFGLS